MRLYNSICEAIEAWAARTRTEALENEFDHVDWALMGADEDDD